MMRATLRIGLLAALLPTLACDKLLHRGADAGTSDAAADAGVDAGAVADAGDDDGSVEPAPMLDAGAATTTHATAAPATLVGTYGGQVRHSGNFVYSISAVLDGKDGVVTYGAPLTCKATWTLASYDAPTKTWHYKEHVIEASGKRPCPDNREPTITEVKPGASWIYAEGNIAHGNLTKVK